MLFRPLLILSPMIALWGCAPPIIGDDSYGGVYTVRMQQAADQYVSCVSGEAEKEAKSAASAEDIAVAAQGRCWERWDAYRVATNRRYFAGARSREELQLAHDQADAHLRQFERETRRSVIDRIVQRNLGANEVKR